MPHGQWFRDSGTPKGCVTRRRTGWAVVFTSASYKRWKSGFPDRASAEKWRRRKSNKHLLTRNRIRKKVGHPRVREMMIHRKGQSWTGDFATFSARDLPLVVTHGWSFNGRGYVISKISGKLVRLCDLLQPPPSGLVNDHINRDRTDDRRENLEVVTPAQNNRNQKKRSDNTSGENGISECHSACFSSYDQGKWLAPRRVSTNKPAGRNLRKEASDLRDRLGAKTKRGGTPKICYDARWNVSICPHNANGGTGSFRFDTDDAADRQRAFEEAIAYRDMLQKRCTSTNGKPATQT